MLALPLPAELSPANIAQTRQRWQWALPTQCMIEEVASASGSDPFPHRNYVRG